MRPWWSEFFARRSRLRLGDWNWFFQPLRKKIFLKIRRRRSRRRSSTWKIDATKLEFVGVEIQQ